jgi:hypothetical protein
MVPQPGKRNQEGVRGRRRRGSRLLRRQTVADHHRIVLLGHRVRLVGGLHLPHVGEEAELVRRRRERLEQRRGKTQRLQGGRVLRDGHSRLLQIGVGHHQDGHPWRIVGRGRRQPTLPRQGRIVEHDVGQVTSVVARLVLGREHRYDAAGRQCRIVAADLQRLLHCLESRRVRHARVDHDLRRHRVGGVLQSRGLEIGEGGGRRIGGHGLSSAAPRRAGIASDGP